jgi:hypothetical protein
VIPPPASTCGNGTKEGNEACDDGASGGSDCNADCTTPACGDDIVNTQFSPPGGSGVEQCEPPNTTTCDAHCRNLPPVTVTPVCPNGIQEHGEQCDGSDFDGFTCTELGHDGGNLSCNGSCGFVTTHCFDFCDGTCGSGDGETTHACGSGSGDCP